jgi:hypothetical protein
MGATTRKRLILLTLGVLASSVASATAAAPRPDPWLGLAGGHLGKFLWSVETKRPDGPAGAGQPATRRPCLLVGTSLQVSPFDLRRSRSRQCAAASGLSAFDPPLVAKGVQAGAGGRGTVTAVGMMLAPAARRVRATFADGSTQTIHLSALTPAEAREVGLARFRYAAFATRGDWCVERLVVQSASGRTLWDSGIDAYTCGTAGPPRFASG